MISINSSGFSHLSLLISGIKDLGSRSRGFSRVFGEHGTGGDKNYFLVLDDEGLGTETFWTVHVKSVTTKPVPLLIQKQRNHRTQSGLVVYVNWLFSCSSKLVSLYLTVDPKRVEGS